MTIRDEFQQLVLNATYAVCVVGHGTEFELIDVATGAQLETIRARDGFVGVIGIVEGHPRTALAADVEDLTISALSQAFVQRIEDAITAVERAMGTAPNLGNDFTNLPDNRNGAN